MFFDFILLLSNFLGLPGMSCANNTELNIQIPVITISKTEGHELNKSITNGMRGQI